MAIKTFKFNENDDIDNIINEWAEKNRFKIDNISCCPLHLYYNNMKDKINEIDIFVIVNYHKRRNYKKKIEKE